MIIKNHLCPYFNSKEDVGRWLYDRSAQFTYGTGVSSVTIEGWKDSGVELLGPSELGYWDDA